NRATRRSNRARASSKRATSGSNRARAASKRATSGSNRARASSNRAALPAKVGIGRRALIQIRNTVHYFCHREGYTRDARRSYRFVILENIYKIILVLVQRILL